MPSQLQISEFKVNSLQKLASYTRFLMPSGFYHQSIFPFVLLPYLNICDMNKIMVISIKTRNAGSTPLDDNCNREDYGDIYMLRLLSEDVLKFLKLRTR